MDATTKKKRGDGECQEGTPGMRGKKKKRRERRGGRGQEKYRWQKRRPATKTQSGRAGG